MSVELPHRGRTVIGYHGCDRKTAEKVLANKEKLKPSENEYDWLGKGVYFWEYNFIRAMQWAKNNRNSSGDPYVIGAIVNLGNCLDLVSSDELEKLKGAYKSLELLFKKAEKELPVNSKEKDETKILRRLDCAVVNHYHDITDHWADTVRGVFWEGKALYPNSEFREQNHIQISVINPVSIIGVFRPSELT